MNAIAVVLRRTEEQDLPVLFTQQLGYTDPPDDRATFDERWRKILAAPTVVMRTIVAGDRVVGYIGHFTRKGLPEVNYCLGKEYWGRGLATAALQEFLGELTIRPLYARVEKGNVASIRVLQKCGFSIVGEDRFVTRRGSEAEEFLFALK